MVHETTQETKPFYLTSEFWIHTLGQLLLWVGALPTAGAPAWAKTAISLALVASYGLSRGLAKSGAPKTVTSVQGDAAELLAAPTSTKAAGYEPPSGAQISEASSALGGTVEPVDRDQR